MLVRIGGTLLCMLGFWLLFAPMINALRMIPFVGYLLSSFVFLAAVIFSIVIGLTLSVLTIAIAWVYFRPIVGIPLLALVSISTYLTFFYDW